MLALALALGLVTSAPPAARLVYEQKCLYCHSEEIAERRRLPEAQWRRLVEQMRAKAPLLITRSDVPLLARYMARTLKLVPPRAPSATAPRPDAGVALPSPVVELKPLPELEPLEPGDGGTSDEPAPQVATEESAVFELMQRRCSKCHTLGRVFEKLDRLDRSLSVLERMRLKTGSGITERDAERIEAFMRSQL